MGEIIQIYRDRKKQEGIPMKLGFVTAILDSWTYEEVRRVYTNSMGEITKIVTVQYLHSGY